MDYDKLIAPAAKAMRPSGIRKFFDLAAEMPECISLGVGEPDFSSTALSTRGGGKKLPGPTAKGGIGSEICRVLAEDGWQVAVCYKNGRAAAEALVSELKERGLCAEVFYCDIGDKDSIDKCVAEVRDSLGFVTLLVNNAGTADIELFTDMTDEKLCDMMNVNLLGAMRMSRAVLPEMIREHSGNVINITSVWGEKGASCEVAYSAAKAGLIGFTKALAREVAIKASESHM